MKIEKLDYGDYSLEGLEKYICIERKKGGNELYLNCATKTNRERLFREFERMQECKHRFLVIEETLDQILSPSSYYAVRGKKLKSANPRMAPAVVINTLQEIMMKYNVHVIFAGKSKGKNITKGLLLKAYKEYMDANGNPD